MALLYPLDVIRCHLQAQADKKLQQKWKKEANGSLDSQTGSLFLLFAWFFFFCKTKVHTHT